MRKYYNEDYELGYEDGRKSVMNERLDFNKVLASEITVKSLFERILDGYITEEIDEKYVENRFIDLMRQTQRDGLYLLENNERSKEIAKLVNEKLKKSGR